MVLRSRAISFAAGAKARGATRALSVVAVLWSGLACSADRARIVCPDDDLPRIELPESATARATTILISLEGTLLLRRAGRDLMDVGFFLACK